MKSVILDGTIEAGDLVSTALLDALRGRLDADTVVFSLRTLRMAHCLGDFDCWVRTPGLCHTRDEANEIAGMVRHADAVFIVGPTSFGGYPSEAKKALDRIINLLLPFFERRASQSHHPVRYQRLPSLFAALWHPQPTAELGATLQRLVERNAINFISPRHGAVLLGPDASRWTRPLNALVAEARRQGSSAVQVDLRREHAALIEAASPEDRTTGGAPRNVVLLVGSPKPTGTSTSEVLGRELAGAGAQVHFVTEVIHDTGRCADDALGADLFVLAAPLYIDSLPFLVTRALERVANRAAGRAARPRFAAVINCGFPEAEQCIPALQIARQFAAEAGMRWAGGLAVGGGGMIGGKSLQAMGRVAARVRAGLEAAAVSLRRGEGIPASAILECATPLIAPWIYRGAVNLGWWRQARRNGLSRTELRLRPLDSGGVPR